VPKSKPTQVIVHRIELQEKERELIEPLLISQSYKNVVIPTAILGGVGAATYIGYKSAKKYFDWTDDLVQDMKDSYIVQKLKSPVDYYPSTHVARYVFKLFGVPFKYDDI
jgi:hypothetical protein